MTIFSSSLDPVLFSTFPKIRTFIRCLLRLYGGGASPPFFCILVLSFFHTKPIYLFFPPFTKLVFHTPSFYVLFNSFISIVSRILYKHICLYNIHIYIKIYVHKNFHVCTVISYHVMETCVLIEIYNLFPI